MHSGNHLPPLNGVRVFEVVARHLNFRLAAEEIGVTQGAVAQQIRGLEDFLQVKLFKRLPRGLILTDEGRSYLPSISRAIGLISKATEDLRPQKTVLSVSMPPSFATKWFVPRLSDFADTYPDVDVRLDASETLSNFQSDGVDLAIRMGKTPFPSGLKSIFLFNHNSLPVCSPSYLTNSSPITTIEQLSNHMLLHDAHGHWQVFLDKNATSSGIATNRNLKFNQTAHAIDAAIAGQGIALACDALITEDIRNGKLCYVFDDKLNTEILQNEESNYGFHLVYPRKPRNPQTVELMQHWILDQLT